VTVLGESIKLLWINFNPHSREGSDGLQACFKGYCIISIHTPAKGVTTADSYTDTPQAISIHTPAKGVTCAIQPGFHCDPISIHTPAKGVTNSVFSCAS